MASKPPAAGKPKYKNRADFLKANKENVKKKMKWNKLEIDSRKLDIPFMLEVKNTVRSKGSSTKGIRRRLFPECKSIQDVNNCSIYDNDIRADEKSVGSNIEVNKNRIAEQCDLVQETEDCLKGTTDAYENDDDDDEWVEPGKKDNRRKRNKNSPRRNELLKFKGGDSQDGLITPP